MGLKKNTAGQVWLVFAFDSTTNLPVTGDAANITAAIAKDAAAEVATNDVNPTEVLRGYYRFTLTQAESNADVMDIFPVSSTGDVEVVGVPVTQTTGGDIMAAGDIDGFTLEEAQKLILASAAAKLSGATASGTGTVAIRAADDSKTRITADYDENGNRTAVTLDATG